MSMVVANIVLCEARANKEHDISADPVQTASERYPQVINIAGPPRQPNPEGEAGSRRT